MTPKLRRSLPPVRPIVTLAALALAAPPLWNWSVDHLPTWASLLVLLGILGAFWVTGRYFRRRREAEETRDAEALASE